MGRGRKPTGKAKSNLQRQHDYLDAHSSIDAYIDEKVDGIDWKRRTKAEKSLPEWVKTYCVPLLLNDEPPPLGEEVLNQMAQAITSHENYMICMGRGSGKTSYVECAALYAIATGLQKYVVVISANQNSANGIMKDIFRAVAEVDTPFAQDYPMVTAPFHLANGAFRRRQLYRGVSTDIQFTASELVFARMRDDNGNDYPTSGSVISCRGVTSSLRGMKHGVLRPSFAILDDLQSSESATNPNAVEKLMDAIRKDVMPLAGKERLSVLQTATPICPEDLVQKIKEDRSWKTTIFPSVISFPKNEELWNEYFALYDEESANKEPHYNSLDFYKKNRREMDEGSSVFNPTRYSERDGHISAIQKLLELRHTLGESAFLSEYQMTPKALTYSLNISPEIVMTKKSSLKELQLPSENVQWVCASTDLNLAKYLTTTIVVFMRDQTATVIYHHFRPCHIPINIPEQDYYQRVYNLLGEHGRELKQIADQHHIKLDAWAIDANGVPFKAVTDFAKKSFRICGVPACGMIGRASHLFRSFIRSRLKEEVNRTLLCGDAEERRQSGSGKKWMYFDSDFYHELAQKGFLQELGNLGSLSWYDGSDHAKWAIQVCAEKLLMKRARNDGTVEYHWKDNGDHDALDSIGQALAAYASQGFANGNTGRSNIKVARQRVKKRVRFV